VLGDAERVRALVAGGRGRARAALEQLAADGPPAEQFADWYGYYQYQPDPNLGWARERGLVVTAPVGPPQVPREVAVALRGPDWHAPFTPHPPVPALAEVDGTAVDREAAAAGSAAVDQLTALLEAIGAAPVAMLKAGGVGVKELRRLAKAIGTDEQTARLWLELAYQAALIGPQRESPQRESPPRGSTANAAGRRGTSPPAVLLPTLRYDEWAASQPAERLAPLLATWLALPALPPRALDPRDRPPPALVRDHDGHIAAAVREQVVQFAAALPAGRTVTDETRVAGAVCWHSPLLLGSQPDADRLIAAAWSEARLLGVIAHGALTSLGRALVAGSPPELAAACRALLPAAVDEAIFQADLTALVPGTPAGPLAELLDTVAEREAGGSAVTWRFTAASVRRALDGGYRMDRLLAALRDRAAGGRLPQPLEYLIADVARRHGAVRVRPVACVLHGEDPALLAEIASARALRPLQLTTIAPTVLGSAAPVTETLAALRSAGYAPVGEAADGAPQLERVERRRAATPANRRHPPGERGRPAGPVPVPEPEPEPVDLVAMARALLAAPVPSSVPAPVPSPVPPPRGRPDLAELERQLATRGFLSLPEEGEEGEVDVAAELAELATHLAPGERRLLAHAIETTYPVKISYINAQGGHSQRVIEPLELDGTHLIAWCQLRDDERVFALHRIASVAPA
jgi:hypothetical protein